MIAISSVSFVDAEVRSKARSAWLRVGVYLGILKVGLLEIVSCNSWLRGPSTQGK